MVGKRGHLLPDEMTPHQVYYGVGKLISHAVLNGCHGLPGLSPALVHYITSGLRNLNAIEDSSPPVAVADVADEGLRQLLNKVSCGEQLRR